MGFFDNIVDKVRNATNTNGSGFNSTIGENGNNFKGASPGGSGNNPFQDINQSSNPHLKNNPKYAVKSLMNKYAWCSFGGNYLANDGASGAMNTFMDANHVGLYSNLDMYKSPSAKNIIEWSKSIYDSGKVTKTPIDTPDAEGAYGQSSLVKDKDNNWVRDKNIPYKSAYHSGMESTNSAAFTAKQNVRDTDNITRKSLPPTLGNLKYEWKDFAYCKHYGKIPNNRLITLRRFKAPCLDSGAIAGKSKLLEAILPKSFPGESDEDYLTSDSARALTYFGDGTNKLDSLMGFTWGLNWKEIHADMGNPQINDKSFFMNDNNPFISMDARNFGNPITALKNLATGKGLGFENATQDAKDTALNNVFGVWMLYNQYEAAKKGAGKEGGVDVPGIDENSTLQDFVIAMSPEQDSYKQGYMYRIYGDINVIHKTNVRERGFSWGGDTITLQFNYDMSQIDSYNTKMVMLDIISNMLALTYNDANFYGGDYRFMRTPTEFPIPPTIQDMIQQIGAGNTNISFNDMWEEIKNIIPTYAPYKTGMQSLANVGQAGADVYDDVSNLFTGLNAGKDGGKLVKTNKDGKPELNVDAVGGYVTELLESLKNYMIDSGGNVGMVENLAFATAFKDLRSFDGIQKNIVSLKPLITGEPIGEWHLTVGNPMNPIMMIGNLICTGASMKFSETLGPDDFPTELSFSITLKHARQRDKGDIESMFNHGQGRFYIKVADFPEPWNSGFSTKNTANDTANVNNPASADREQQGTEDLTGVPKGQGAKTAKKYENYATSSPTSNWSVDDTPFSTNDTGVPGYLTDISKTTKTNFKQGLPSFGKNNLTDIYF